MSLEEKTQLLKLVPECMKLNPKDLSGFVYHTEVNGEFMGMYTSSMSTFISLSIAAIGLSIAFREKVLGQKGPLQITRVLFSSWTSLLVTVAAGTLYLYAAPKHIENRLKCGDFIVLGIVTPGFIYGVALTFFVIGCCLLFLAILQQHKDA